MFTDRESFLALPWPAQALTAVVLLFGLFVVTRMVAGMFVRPRHRAHFARLAESVGARTGPRGDMTFFDTSIGDRAFTVRHELRSSAGSYRGPTGNLLVLATRLEARRWEMHQVDMNLGSVRARTFFGHNLLASGDEAFDAQIAVREDGIPVREGWLDRPTREAILRVYELPYANGPMWVQAQELTHISRSPWTEIDAAKLREMLGRVAAVAGALERTARG